MLGVLLPMISIAEEHYGNDPKKLEVSFFFLEEKSEEFVIQGGGQFQKIKFGLRKLKV